MNLRMAAMVCMALGLLACEAPMARGLQAYHDGCYPESVERLMGSEGQMRGADAPQRARYALYRGLAHLAVGDVELANRWLAEAKALWDWDRSVLDTQDTGRMLSGWQALGHEPGEWGGRVLALHR
jgi:hypothetical protein